MVALPQNIVGDQSAPVYAPYGASGRTVVSRYSIAVTATDIFSLLYADDTDLVVEEVTFIPDDGLAADNTDYYTMDVQDRGSDGTGTTSLVSSPKTTRVTGGAALVAHDAVEMGVDQNTILAKGNTLAAVVTETNTETFPAGVWQVRFRRKL